MNAEIRSLFPAAEKYTYLNSAAVAPMPTTAVDAVMSQLRDVSANGSEHYTDWIATKERSRSLIGEMLGVRPEQIAFMRNTSDGFAAVANGLPWSSGDNIVSFAEEFPSNFYPWRMVRDEHGVELRMAPERDGRIDLDELVGMIDANTKLVAISAVQYASGFRADLARIGEAARKAGALFAVDIIQGFGAMGFDLPEQMVDIASCASHKWLCSPEGCGFLYLSDDARDRVKPTFVGWISVETPWDFVDREQPFKPNALALESGTGCSSLFYGLEQSLSLLDSAGLTNIESYLLGLSDRLCEGLSGKDYTIVSSRREGERSQIVCVKHNGGRTSNELYDTLKAENVIVSPRGDRLRIAPHFFNNASDIDRIVDCLP
jgi:selenocysteine lyase/cysteine desulfurase